MSEDGLTKTSKPIVNYTEDDSEESPKVGKIDTSRIEVNTTSLKDKSQEEQNTMDSSRSDANTSTSTAKPQEEDKTMDTSKSDANTSVVTDKEQEENKTMDTSRSDANTSILTAKAQEEDKTMDTSRIDHNNNKGNIGKGELCEDGKVEDNEESNIAEKGQIVVAQVHAVEELTQEDGVLNLPKSAINDEGNISKQGTIVVAEVHAVQNLMDENADVNEESQDSNSKVIGIIKSEDGDLNVAEGILTTNHNTDKTNSIDQTEQKTDEDLTIDPVGIDGPSLDIAMGNMDEAINSSGKMQRIKLSIEQLGASHETDGTVESIDITKAGNIVPYYGSTDVSMNTSTVTDKGQQDNYNIDNRPDESIEFTEVIDLPQSETIETVQEEGVMSEEGKIIRNHKYPLISLNITISPKYFTINLNDLLKYISDKLDLYIGISIQNKAKNSLDDMVSWFLDNFQLIAKYVSICSKFIHYMYMM